MSKAENLRYFTEPTFGDTCTGTSGTSMQVVLGPEATQSGNYGSPPNGCINSRMKPLNEKDYGLWIAGHLLNDNLGGSGRDPKNLTPLTQTANRQHAAYEGKIKTAIEASYSLMTHKTVTFFVGVKYEVNVSSEVFGDFAPYNKAPSHISIEASLVKVDKSTNDISVLGITDMAVIPRDYLNAFRAAVFTATIDNDDKHLSD